MVMKVIKWVWGEAGSVRRDSDENCIWATIISHLPCHRREWDGKMYKNRNQREFIASRFALRQSVHRIKVTQKFRSHFGADFYFYLACFSSCSCTDSSAGCLFSNGISFVFKKFLFDKKSYQSAHDEVFFFSLRRSFIHPKIPWNPSLLFHVRCGKLERKKCITNVWTQPTHVSRVKEEEEMHQQVITTCEECANLKIKSSVMSQSDVRGETASTLDSPLSLSWHVKSREMARQRSFPVPDVSWGWSRSR